MMEMGHILFDFMLIVGYNDRYQLIMRGADNVSV